MEKGTVKFFNHVKGFGFIKIEGQEREVFVHKTGLIDEIKDNDTVEFKLEDTPKGPSAVEVRKA